MEGVFSFFLESSFLGLFLFGEERLGPRKHWWPRSRCCLAPGFSGFFIIATNAWMQHPVAYTIEADGRMVLSSLWGLLSNPWARWQYPHTIIGSVVTAAFVMASIGAFYCLQGRHQAYARTFLRLGVTTGLISSLLMPFPTGDGQNKNVAKYQPATLAAMEGLFETTQGAPLAIIGQPDTQQKKLDNPILVPRMLSFLMYQRWMAEVKGLDAFPEDEQPENIRAPVLQLSHDGRPWDHLHRGDGGVRLEAMEGPAVREHRLALGHHGSCCRFPYIANTTGWITAEIGRQPWIIHGLLRISDGVSLMSRRKHDVHADRLMGVYALLSMCSSSSSIAKSSTA